MGGFVWSPDGKEIAFGTCRTTRDYLRIAKSSIKIYSLELHSTRTLMEVKNDFLQVVTWAETDPLEIKKSDESSFTSTYDVYDWNTMGIGTPEPTTPSN